MFEFALVYQCLCTNSFAPNFGFKKAFGFKIIPTAYAGDANT